MFEIEKEFRWEAAHSLPMMPDGHQCKRPHGHSYKLVVCCRGEKAGDFGFACGLDYADLAFVVRARVVDRLDHQNMNDFVSPSTAECLCEWIWDQLSELPGLHRVDLYETPTTRLSYFGSSDSGPVARYFGGVR